MSGVEQSESEEDVPLEMHRLFAQGDTEIYRCAEELWFVRRSTWKQTLVLVIVGFWLVVLGGIAAMLALEPHEAGESPKGDPVALVVFLVIAVAIGGFAWQRRREIRRGPPERLPLSVRTDRAKGELATRHGWLVARLEEVHVRVTKVAYGGGFAYTVTLDWPGVTREVLDATDLHTAESARATIDTWLEENVARDPEPAA